MAHVFEKALAIREAEYTSAYLDGKDEGTALGKVEGIADGIALFAKKLLKRNVPIQEIA